MKNRQIKSVSILPAGNVAAFDINGSQIPELQTNLLALWAEEAECQGIDVDGVIVQWNGTAYRITRNSSPEGFKWLLERHKLAA